MGDEQTCWTNLECNLRKDDIYTTATNVLMKLPKPREGVGRKAGSRQDPEASEDEGSSEQLMPAFTEMVTYISERVSLP